MSNQEQCELLEQTLAELEAQQFAAQQLINDAVNELECLYGEIRAQGEQLAAACGAQPSHTPPAENPQRAAEFELLQRERDLLEMQLLRMAQEMEQMEEGAADAPELENGNVKTARDSIATESPAASALRAPFEALRLRSLGTSTPDSAGATDD